MFCKFCKTFRHFDQFCKKSHTLLNTPIPYKTDAAKITHQTGARGGLFSNTRYLSTHHLSSRRRFEALSSLGTISELQGIDAPLSLLSHMPDSLLTRIRIDTSHPRKHYGVCATNTIFPKKYMRRKKTPQLIIYRSSALILVCTRQGK